jgi:hypothetical protein
MDRVETYKAYRDNIGNRDRLYEVVQKEFSIEKALYPGSHIDISPSLYIPQVTYVDNFKGAIKFFDDLKTLENYIEGHKYYEEKSIINFYGQDYTRLKLQDKYDLIISQYAGFVGQATKKFLKKGGYLLCNDSHGDASLAYHDGDYELVAVVSNQYKIIRAGLEDYFKLKSQKPVDLEKVEKTMKGPKYQKISENYIFKRKD